MFLNRNAPELLVMFASMEVVESTIRVSLSNAALRGDEKVKRNRRVVHDICILVSRQGLTNKTSCRLP